MYLPLCVCMEVLVRFGGFWSGGYFGVWLFGLVVVWGLGFFFFLSVLSLDSKRKSLELVSYVLVC